MSDQVNTCASSSQVSKFPMMSGESNQVNENDDARNYSNSHMKNGANCNNCGKQQKQFEPGKLKYSEYLQLDSILTCQNPVSRMSGTEVHDEHLFIVTHQAYELWFKQIIYELDSVRNLISEKIVNETNMLKINSQLNRIVLILKLLVDQWQILHSMTPLDFIEFRHYLRPASGFQSVQFRLIENKLGVRPDFRSKFGRQNYRKVFQADDDLAKQIQTSEEEPSLCLLVQRWLERTPGLEKEGFDFWTKYRSAVNIMLQDELDNSNRDHSTSLSSDEDRSDISDDNAGSGLCPIISGNDKPNNEKTQYETKKTIFDALFNAERYEELRQRGDVNFSYKSLQGALMVFLYRDEPRFNQPFQILTSLQAIDQLLVNWRANHVQMVLRMIGAQQMGTGGSSGYQYLRTTLTDRYRVFNDLFNLSTFIIARKYLPELTSDIKTQLRL